MYILLKKIRGKLSEMKIGSKITLYYLTLTIISILLSIFIYQQTNAYYIKQQIHEIAAQGIESDSRNFELFIEDINNYSKILLANQSIQQMLEAEREQLPNYKNLHRFLQEFINFNTKVSSIYVFSNSGRKYYTEKATFKEIELEDIEKKDFYQEIIGKKGGFILRTNENGLRDPNNNPNISFMRVINSLYRQDKIGFLIINLNQKVLKEALGFDQENGASILIQDEDGKFIVDYNAIEEFDKEIFLKKLDERDEFWDTIDINGTYRMVSGINNKKYGWKVLKIIPFQDLSEQLNAFNIGIVAIILVNVLLLLLGSLFISKLITNPIHSLIHSMKDVENGHFNPVHIKTNDDEIGMLKNVYNFMIDKIHQLIEKIITEQKTKRKAELGIMMEQIKPHFLYNTIDSISSLVILNRTEEAYDSLRALGNFYRTSLSNGRDIITIREELDTIENYLYIQKIRYGNLFEAAYEIDEVILDIKVPKLILQPLVENSIYHGIRPSGSKGYIKITAKKLQNKVRLVVWDNGIGISEENIKILSTASEKSVGIPATRERIRILFGDQSSFSISSQPEKGTEVVIDIPLWEEEGF